MPNAQLDRVESPADDRSSAPIRRPVVFYSVAALSFGLLAAAIIVLAA